MLKHKESFNNFFKLHNNALLTLNNNRAIQFAQKTVVLQLLSENPMALEHVAQELKANIGVVKAAFEKKKASLKFAHAECVKTILKDDWTALQ